MRERSDSAGPAVLPTAKAGGYVCAICGTKVPAAASAPAGPEGTAAKTATAHRYRPFCSARCQRIDLGNWLDERYVVPGSPAATEVSDEEEE